MCILIHVSFDYVSGFVDSMQAIIESSNSLVTYRAHRGINLSTFSAAYMGPWIRSALVQIMVCCLFRAKQLSEPVLGYFQ